MSMWVNVSGTNRWWLFPSSGHILSQRRWIRRGNPEEDGVVGGCGRPRAGSCTPAFPGLSLTGIEGGMEAGIGAEP